MARPKKSGLDYFPFDVDFFSNKKIKILKSRYGTNGVIIYIYLLCEIYKNGYYVIWDEDYKYIIADELNLTDGLIEQVLKFLVKRSLLCSILFNSDTILTSPGIQSRFQEAVKPRASKSPVSVIKELWLLTKEKTQGFIKVISFKGFSENNSSFSENNSSFSENNSVKESKVKERKVKESDRSCRSTLSKYGKFNNVLLSDDDINKLANLYPNSYKAKIDYMSAYMASSGKHYPNHCAKLVEWLDKDKDEEKADNRKFTSYDIDELEKFKPLGG